MKYSYNNGRIAADPQLACMNFLNALEKIPGLIEKFKADTEKIAKDIPVLQEVVNGSWKKEEQLKDLKTELAALDRKIQLSLKPIGAVGEYARGSGKDAGWRKKGGRIGTVTSD